MSKVNTVESVLMGLTRLSHAPKRIKFHIVRDGNTFRDLHSSNFRIAKKDKKLKQQINWKETETFNPPSLCCYSKKYR